MVKPASQKKSSGSLGVVGKARLKFESHLKKTCGARRYVVFPAILSEANGASSIGSTLGVSSVRASARHSDAEEMAESRVPVGMKLPRRSIWSRLITLRSRSSQRTMCRAQLVDMAALAVMRGNSKTLEIRPNPRNVSYAPTQGHIPSRSLPMSSEGALKRAIRKAWSGEGSCFSVEEQLSDGCRFWSTQDT